MDPAAQTQDERIVWAKPSKAFFIDMITRDLTVADCILDLIDNSIDQALETKRVDIMKMLMDGSFQPALKSARVKVSLSEDRLVVEDTCGGISIPEARDKIFLFGNPNVMGAPAGLSVYGIGMKRAFFKLGREIRISSATQSDWWTIEIDVDKWKRLEDDWTFRFSALGHRSVGDRSHPPGVTRVEILKIRDEVKKLFQQTSFRKDLWERLGSTYALFLQAGFSIQIDNEQLEAKLPTIGRTKEIVPATKLLRTDDVRTLIIAGVRSIPADAPSSGWYVFCNGRMVLGADKSHVTGWGGLMPLWHTKYRGFAGYVYFSSRDVRLLPWTTTKQGVVYEASVYQTALREMQVQARPVLNFLNKVYPGDVEEEEVPERSILSKVQAVSIDKTAKKETAFQYVTPPKRPDDVLISIQYKRSRKNIDRIRKHVGKPNLSASRVGEYTFDHFLKMEVEQ